jgi:hypothetical protein
VWARNSIRRWLNARGWDGVPRYKYRGFGLTGRFCLVLKIVEPLDFGPDFVEIAGDVTAEAFQVSESSAGSHASDGG